MKTENQITFQEWASLMDEVYKENNNGKWAVLYGVMSALKPVLYDINVIQTALFITGCCGSGKSEIADSISSLFKRTTSNVFNISTGTNAAVISLITSKTNVPIIFDQYVHHSTSEYKFKLLKIASKGFGRVQKYYDASLGSMNIKVKRPIIIISQDMPSMDKYSLCDHAVVLNMDSYNNHYETQRNVDAFINLKMHERASLQQIHSEILKEKNTIIANYIDVLGEVFRDIHPRFTSYIEKHGLHTRQSHSFRLFLAMCKLIEDHTNLKLPFTYKEFLEIAFKELKTQPSKLVTTL